MSTIAKTLPHSTDNGQITHSIDNIITALGTDTRAQALALALRAALAGDEETLQAMLAVAVINSPNFSALGWSLFEESSRALLQQVQGAGDVS